MNVAVLIITPDAAREEKAAQTGGRDERFCPEKGDTYYIVLALGPKRKWLRVGPDKKEAERALAIEVPKAHAGPYRELKKITFAGFAKQWLQEYA
jgi:hypothetical protein